MSDFILRFGAPLRPGSGVAYLQQPYGAHAPTGEEFSKPWGELSILRDACAEGQNFVTSDGVTVGWVGDWPTAGRGKAVTLLMTAVRAAQASGKAFARTLQSELARSGVCPQINGASAVVAIAPQGCCVITDPFSSVQVYAGRNSDGAIRAVGTHPDLVALASGDKVVIDPVSVCDFISTGTPCWPYTIYPHVRELDPGSVHCFVPEPEGSVEAVSWAHWSAPKEASIPLSELVEEFGKAWKSAVEVRATGQFIAVQLSGGMDSRLVLAAIPREKRCVGLTLCDSLNREALIARQVAEVYGREWQTLQRDEEYVGRTAVDSIRFTGCEGEWHHAHSIGFAGEVAKLGANSVFTGLFMDNNFKGYYAKDVKRVPRWRGLLPAEHKIVSREYVNRVSDTCRKNLRAELVAASVARRQAFFDPHFARQRQSPWEWLDGYPLTQASDNTGWIVERRFFPLRLPVMDRRMVDLAFRVPMQMKAGGRYFTRSASAILGPGNRVPNANDGVKPGSGHAAFLVQRGKRKMQGQSRRLLTALGVRLPVPHSWHDYQTYWAESEVLRKLVKTHGGRLREFESDVFLGDSRGLLERQDLPWRESLRLLQLAVWRDIIDGYRSLDGH